MNILYLHGYHVYDEKIGRDVNDSTTIKNIKQAVKEKGLDIKLNFLTPQITIDLFKNDENALRVLENEKRCVDLIIGNSFGCLTALSLCSKMEEEGLNIPTILINPCLNPKKEIPLIDKNIVHQIFFDFYEDYVKELSFNLHKTPKIILENIDVIISSRDSVMSKTYEDELREWTNGFAYIQKIASSNHQLSIKEVNRYILPFIININNSKNNSFDLKKINENLYFNQNYEKQKRNQLFEHFVNVFEENEMSEYANEVFDLLTNAYRYIGGLEGIVNSPEELIQESKMWKMVRRNGKIVAVFCYKKGREGRKCFLSGTDGSQLGKEAYYKILSEDLTQTNRCVLVETSANAFRARMKSGWDKVVIPSYIVKDFILPDKDIEIIENEPFWYYRTIGGEKHKKICLGNYVLENGEYAWTHPITYTKFEPLTLKK